MSEKKISSSAADLVKELKKTIKALEKRDAHKQMYEVNGVYTTAFNLMQLAVEKSNDFEAIESFRSSLQSEDGMFDSELIAKVKIQGIPTVQRGMDFMDAYLEETGKTKQDLLNELLHNRSN